MNKVKVKMALLIVAALLLGFCSGYVKGYGTGFRNGEKTPNRCKIIELQNCPCEFDVQAEELII